MEVQTQCPQVLASQRQPDVVVLRNARGPVWEAREVRKVEGVDRIESGFEKGLDASECDLGKPVLELSVARSAVNFDCAHVQSNQQALEAELFVACMSKLWPLDADLGILKEHSEGLGINDVTEDHMKTHDVELGNGIVLRNLDPLNINGIDGVDTVGLHHACAWRYFEDADMNELDILHNIEACGDMVLRSPEEYYSPIVVPMK